MTYRMLHFVEVGEVKSFKPVNEIAKRYGGKYLGSGHTQWITGYGFLFGKEADAKAFLEEARPFCKE